MGSSPGPETRRPWAKPSGATSPTSRFVAVSAAQLPGPSRLAGVWPALDVPAFVVALLVRIARELRTFKSHAVLAQGAHEIAAALSARKRARAHTAVIVDLHVDWRAPTRPYGSQLRGL